MGPIEAALFGIAILTAYAVYKSITMKLALLAREDMVVTVEKIMNDPAAQRQLKEQALVALHNAAAPNFWPYVAWVFFRYGVKIPDEERLSDEHQKVLNNLIREHFFRVNMLAAPHWYAVIGILFFALVVVIGVLTLGRRGSLRILTTIEKAVLHPAVATSR